MDDLDRKILSLLVQNARMPVKEIAEQVSLTSPAVSSRIHKMETDGIINGYTVLLNRPADQVYVDAPDQSFGRPLPPGGAAGAFAEQPGGAAVLPRYRRLHLFDQGQLQQYAPAGASDHGVSEAGHHQHPDHPLHPGQPSGAGCAAAVKNNRSVFTHSSCLFLALNCEQFII